jgi:hypothetical protein
MKLFIYTTPAGEKAPFDRLYQNLGSGYQKVIFSNQDKYLTAFSPQQEAAIELILSSVPNSADEKKVFIPLAMKDMFTEFLKKFFKSHHWQEEDEAQKPSQQEIGMVGEGPLSTFYQQIEVQSALKPIDSTNGDHIMNPKAKEALKKMMDQVAEEDNEIDVIFIANPEADLGEGVIVVETTPTARAKKINMNALEMQVSQLAKVFQSTTKANLGTLEKGIIQLSEGILRVDPLPGGLLLYSISATREGMETFQYYWKENLPKIQEQAKALVG